MDYERPTVEHDYAELQAHQSQGLSLANTDIISIASRADKTVDAINSITKAALRLTTHLDWVNIGGNPYLQETGTSKIATLMRVSRRIAPPVKAYDPDGSGHYSYSCAGEFEFAGVFASAFGMRSTKDEFFIGSANAKNHDGKLKPQKKPQDVDERDVMQAAYSNCVNRGIKELIPGLRNITMEHLAEAGVDTGKIKGYGFNTGSGSEMTGEAKNQKTDIEKMLREMCGDDKWTRGLEKITAWTTKEGKEMKGKTSVNAITEKAMPVIYGKVKAEYDKWKTGGGKKSATPPPTGSNPQPPPPPHDADPGLSPTNEDDTLPWDGASNYPPDGDGDDR